MVPHTSIDTDSPTNAAAHARDAAPLSLRIGTVSLKRDGVDCLLDCIDRQTPVLIGDFAAEWPALRNWTPDRLSARFGENPVRVYDMTFGDPGTNYMGSVTTLPFAEFLIQTLGDGRDLRLFLYNIAREIPELLNDIALPDVGLRFSKRFVHVFFGCRGATTPLHYDIDMGSVLHTVITGRRRVRLFAPDHSRALYRHPFTVRSYVNLDGSDDDAYPALARARGYELTLEPGQTLFMPGGYWHEFHYAEAGMGVSLRTLSPRLADRARGAFNLIALSPIDRIANRIAPDCWFAWKRRRAAARAKALLRRPERTR